MSRLRKFSPWYWVMLGAYGTVGLLWVLNLALGWGLAWVPLVAMLTVLASNAFVLRMLWKQSDNPAFHRDQRSNGVER